MIKVSLDDPNVVENFKAIQQLRETGDFTDEQLQEMYDRQVAADKAKKQQEGGMMTNVYGSFNEGYERDVVEWTEENVLKQLKKM